MTADSAARLRRAGYIVLQPATTRSPAGTPATPDGSRTSRAANATSNPGRLMAGAVGGKVARSAPPHPPKPVPAPDDTRQRDRDRQREKDDKRRRDERKDDTAMNAARLATFAGLGGGASPSPVSAFDRIRAAIGRPRSTAVEERMALTAAMNRGTYADDKGPDAAVALTRKLGMIRSTAIAVGIGMALLATPAMAQTATGSTTLTTTPALVAGQFQFTGGNVLQKRIWQRLTVPGTTTAIAWCSHTDPLPAANKPDSFPIGAPGNTGGFPLAEEFPNVGQFVYQGPTWCVAAAGTVPLTVDAAP